MDGIQNHNEIDIDCGGTCARKCGFHHVSNIKVGSKDPYHKVSTIPNQELANADESEKPMMVCILFPQKQNKSVQSHFLSLGLTETNSQFLSSIFPFS